MLLTVNYWQYNKSQSDVYKNLFLNMIYSILIFFLFFKIFITKINI